ncbi:serine hydrolase domain-containing protein [Streptacidiphilus jiangxiensis]|uniref:D-alanyl-D-alanine carboxypeptidase n=1 Tax=Streptacidiphilus jiangxiensis TaxID=235985 RepID=A0A1H7TJE7_STRJI|nr:serine hydrolase domain-containing protein [Streptacidiphilus jiangxiensis]SEL84950.1 D-alanyl-D-alanine carboxypeptidase [Streptacidiphilus jiangxiensis]
MPLARRRSAAIAALTALCCTLTAAVPAQAERPGKDQRLQRLLDALVRQAGGPPGAIAVLRIDGRTVVVRAGDGDVRTGRPPRIDDHMRVASVAKTFSGAVALALVSCGHLGLDDTLAQRLPHLPARWGKVTLRQLLQHTSGLPDYSRSPAFVNILRSDPHHRFDSRRLLDFVADKPLEFTPGTRYAYSNSDNIAVALMAEAATHERYETLLERLVYAPLGLDATSLPSGFTLPRPYLHGYAPARTGPEDVSTEFGNSGVWASGGIVSTPRDLSLFIGAYAGGRLVDPWVRRQQLSFVDGSSEPPGPGRNEAGLAIFRYTTRCGVVYGHSGNTPGYTQLAVGTPDGRRSMTFSVNAQITPSTAPAVFPTLRAVEEAFTCALLRGDT